MVTSHNSRIPRAFASLRSAWLGCLVAALLVATLMAGAALAAGGPCQGKSGRGQSRDRFDFRAGVDTRKYRQFPGQAIVALTGDPARDRTRLQEVRLKAYMDALDQVDLLQGVSYRTARQRYRDAFGALVTSGDQSVLRRDIRPLLERDVEDYDKCLYTYEVVLGVRIETHLEELEEPLDAAVAAYLQRVHETDGSLDINLADVFDHLRQDPRFTRQVQEYWNDTRRREPFLYKDDDTQAFLRSIAERTIEISNYDKGQYRPSTVLAAIILRAVRPQVLSFLKHYRRVGVTCVGSTDRLAIKHGLAYAGYGRYLGVGESLEFASTSGRTLEPVLSNNLQLSFARAYEALTVLADGMPRPERLSLRYMGRGESATHAADDPFSRKITFEIRGHERFQ